MTTYKLIKAEMIFGKYGSKKGKNNSLGPQKGEKWPKH
jgi:hypothetical protein